MTRADIAAFHSRLVRTPYQANRALAALSKAFSLAEVWGLRADHSNPCYRIQRFEEKSRERFLTDAEFIKLSEVLDLAARGDLMMATEGGEFQRKYVNPEALRAIRLMLVSGARIGEVLSLRWEYIDFAKMRANLPDSKTGKKVLQLAEPVLVILANLNARKAQGGFVVRGGDGKDPELKLVNIKDPWAVVRYAAGLNDVRIHDLRHAFASVAVGSGMSLPVLGALLGHKDPKTTQRYAHLANDPLRLAANDVASRITKAMSSFPKQPKKE